MELVKLCVDHGEEYPGSKSFFWAKITAMIHVVTKKEIADAERLHRIYLAERELDQKSPGRLPLEFP